MCFATEEVQLGFAINVCKAVGADIQKNEELNCGQIHDALSPCKTNQLWIWILLSVALHSRCTQWKPSISINKPLHCASVWLQQELSRKSLSPNCRGRRKQRESNSDFTVFIINKRRWRSSAVITRRLMFRICSVPWCHFLFNSSPVLMRQSSSWLLKHLAVMVLAVQIQWPSNYKCQDTVRDHHDALQSPLLTRALALRPSKLTELVKLNWLLIRAGKMQKKVKEKV